MSNIKHLNIITLGCSKNLVDSEKIAGKLQPGQYKITHNQDGPSDIVLINTCGFVLDAKEESIDTILKYSQAKTQGHIEEVIVTGCLSQRYKSEISKEIPEVDAWFGVNDTEDIFQYLDARYSDKETDRIISTPSHYAYLKISEGCDRTCSFCAIPLIKGRYRSRTIESLVEEATFLAKKGVKELLMIAQDLSYYGIDLEKKSLLPQLLEELVKIEGIQWIRLHYAYPNNFPPEIIDLMKNNPKLCRYLDIPVQHINDVILRFMRRNSSKKQIMEIIDRVRGEMPDIALRTTLLVGFPGETNEHFQELMQFVKDVKFDRLGVFTYSAEQGTLSYSMRETVTEEDKKKRADEIMLVQQDISEKLNKEKTGKTFKVIIDSKMSTHYHGRTQFDSPEVDNEVLIPVTNNNCKIGEFYNVKIDHATEFDLFGNIVS